MGKAVTVRGKTVEEAVEAALEILGLELQDVRIHVSRTADTGTSPGALRFAEVVVTPVQYKMPDALEWNGEPPSTGIRIISGRVEVRSGDSGGQLSIEAGQGVQVIVNGQKTEGTAPVSERDAVYIRTIDELTRAQLSITIREHGALASLSVIPGRKLTRSVKDAPFTRHLKAEADEFQETVNDLSQQMIRDACDQLGITAVLDKRVLWESCETDVPYEAIIARGIFPKPGLDGDVEIQIDMDGKSLTEYDKVDYREKPVVQLVEEGQLVAAVLPPIPGQPGMDVFGNIIPAEDGKAANIRLGRNVTRTGSHIFAACAGKLLIDRENGSISIDIADTLTMQEVDLASGNVRFDGDVAVRGSVSQGCVVEAAGRIEIGRDVRKAEVKAEKAVHIGGHVSSSRIAAGQQMTDDRVYAESLRSILPMLGTMGDLTKAAAVLRQSSAAAINGGELKKILRVLLGDRYLLFRDRLQSFLTLKSDNASEEWGDLQTTLYNFFINTMHAGVKEGNEFLALIESAERLYEMFQPDPVCQAAELTLSYAVNSMLCCSGAIRITGQGLAQCEVHAKTDIISDGVCRGGELTGERSVSIRECGSKRGVPTVIRTNAHGSIVIGIAHPETILYVGEQSYRVTELQLGITAKMEDGVLRIR
ncbi:FapA family protein [Sporosarcina koreensis]|uniref:FapA family protein n=1 Tax=Sporosarcina koreensis TaxID=334735 RepID=UPI00058D5560|nr:FapA family protein [Sporosarcina koreensis]